MSTLRGRDELHGDKKKMREIISEYKVLSLEQFRKLLKHKETRVVNSIITMMKSDNTLYVHDDICCTKDDWNHYYDPDMIKAFWVILDLMEDIKYHTRGEYPAKIIFITEKDTYDVIVAHKGSESLINMFYKSFADENVKHIIVVDKEEQMIDFRFNNIFAYCIVDDEGNVCYYRNE